MRAADPSTWLWLAWLKSRRVMHVKLLRTVTGILGQFTFTKRLLVHLRTFNCGSCRTKCSRSCHCTGGDNVSSSLVVHVSLLKLEVVQPSQACMRMLVIRCAATCAKCVQVRRTAGTSAWSRRDSTRNSRSGGSIVQESAVSRRMLHSLWLSL